MERHPIRKKTGDEINMGKKEKKAKAGLLILSIVLFGIPTINWIYDIPQNEVAAGFYIFGALASLYFALQRN